MVVRSNGCFACKRRRIKCDQARPSCKRCAIHRTPCPGYPSDTANLINIIVYGSPILSLDSRHHELIPLQVDSAAQKRMQLIASAAEGFTPFGDLPAVPLDLMDISRFNTVSIRQPALDAAVHTIALAQLGVTSKNADLLVHAQREYGRSLRLLNSYIAHSSSSKVWDQQAVSAIVLLAFGECFRVLHQPQPLSIHHLGLKSFYLSRGPFALQNHTESILFCLARNIITGGSLRQRRKCFLEEDEWLTVSLTAPGRDRFFELQDVTVRLPGLTELIDRSLEEEDAALKEAALVQLEGFIQDLENFAKRFWPTPLDTSPPALFDDFHEWERMRASLGDPYRFSNWRSANSFCTWAMVCLVARLEMQRFLLRNSSNPLMPDDIHHKEQVEADIVRNLEDMCRGLPAQIGSPPHSVGIICSFHMLILACAPLEQRGRVVEAEWCKEVLDRLRNDGFGAKPF